MRHFIPLSLFIVLCCCSCFSSNNTPVSSSNKESSSNQESATKNSVKKPKNVTLAFVGDVMMGTNFPSNYLTADSGKTFFMECDSILRSADVAIANLEGTCYNGTEGEVRKMTNPNTYFIFRMPGYLAQNLVNAGIDAVNMANNHSFDFGLTGRQKTLENIKSYNIQVSGLKDMAEVALIERKGVKYAYLGFAASCTRVLDMLNKEQADSLIQKYRPLVDVLIVSFHGGAEGTSYLHVPFKTEYYVGENRGNVHEFAHFCIDKGADIVIGHGPHVPRAMELYNGHLIAYSLGNFCTPVRMGTKGATGFAPLLCATINLQNGTFENGRIHSYLQYPQIGPRRDPQHNATKLIQQLTLSDFPTTALKISNDGLLSK